MTPIHFRQAASESPVTSRASASDRGPLTESPSPSQSRPPALFESASESQSHTRLPAGLPDHERGRLPSLPPGLRPGPGALPALSRLSGGPLASSRHRRPYGGGGGGAGGLPQRETGPMSSVLVLLSLEISQITARGPRTDIRASARIWGRFPRGRIPGGGGGPAVRRDLSSLKRSCRDRRAP